MTQNDEKQLLTYGLMTTFVIIGITYLLTGSMQITGNAGATAVIMLLIAMIAKRYKTGEYLSKNKKANAAVYIILGLCIALVLFGGSSIASALSVNVTQTGKYAVIDITGDAPFEIYFAEGKNIETYSDKVITDLPQGQEHYFVVKDATNSTISKTVNIPIIDVPLEISILVILAVLFGLLGIRYPIFILTSMSLALIWFAFWGTNPDIDETQRILHCVLSITPFISMAYWGINR